MSALQRLDHSGRLQDWSWWPAPLCRETAACCCGTQARKGKDAMGEKSSKRLFGIVGVGTAVVACCLFLVFIFPGLREKYDARRFLILDFRGFFPPIQGLFPAVNPY